MNSFSPLKNNLARSKWAVVVLQITMVAIIISFLNSLFQLYVIKDLNTDNKLSMNIVEYSDALEVAVPFLSLIVLIPTAIVFLNWFRRAYGNLHRLKVKNLQHTELHSVWAFIVPIISLWRPLIIAKEIDLETKKEAHDESERYLGYQSNPIIGWWWAFFIIGNILERIATRVYPDDFNLEKLELSHKITIFTECFSLAAAILAIYMIKNIALNETKLWNKYHDIKNENLFIQNN